MKKIDMTVVKQFLFTYGEKVALGTCAALMLILVVLGLIGATSASGSHYAETLAGIAGDIRSKVSNAPLKEPPSEFEVALKSPFDWPAIASKFAPGPFVFPAVAGDNKRRNPQLLPVNSGSGEIQVDYVRGAAFSYGVDFPKKLVKVIVPLAGGGAAMPGADNPPPLAGGKGGNDVLAKVADPERMVVVSAVYPMAKLIEEYRRYLKFTSQTQMFAERDCLPQPLGLTVQRFEMRGKEHLGKSVTLYAYDPKADKVTTHDKIGKLLARTMYDEAPLPGLEHHIFHGLTTPQPELANAQYPPLKLNGIFVVDDAMPDGAPDRPKGGMKGKKGKEGAGGSAAANHELEYKSWSRLGKDLKPLVERFSGQFDVFHVLGHAPPPVAKAGEAPPRVPGGKGNARGGNRYFSPFDKGPVTKASVPVAAADDAPPRGEPRRGPRGSGAEPVSTADWETDALIRFIDIDVEPGKTYRYEIVVWMQNPNFDKPELVAFADLAKTRVLSSPPVETPSITIPLEYDYYAIDPHAPDAATGKAPIPRANADQAGVQIHRWFDKARDEAENNKVYAIGDWAIAERLLVRRGEWIGVPGIITKVAVWNPLSNQFELPQTREKVTAKSSVTKDGIPLDFTPPEHRGLGKDGREVSESNGSPLLVDFRGGPRHNVVIVPPYTVKDDASAYDLLILGPDGQLTVRNSRADTEAGDVSNVTAKEREDRVTTWRERVDRARATTQPGTGPNGKGVMPGLGGR